MDEKRYQYSITSPDVTGFAVASCTDTNTGIIVRTPLASDHRSFPSSLAYVGAMFSRSRVGMLDLMAKVEGAYSEGKLTPEKKLASIVNGLKHQSPGGMAHVAVAIENIPIITAASLFRTTVLHDGQESSTRFIDFASGNDLPELSTLLPPGAEVSVEILRQYENLQKTSLEFYLNWFPKVYQAYKNHFQVNEDEPKEKSALEARTYDTVRGFLLSGFKTSMVYVTNATTMQQLLSNFGANRLPGEGQLAQTLLALLAPPEEIPGYRPEIQPLLNHTLPNLRTRREQQSLKDFFAQQNGFADLLQQRRTFSGLVDNRCDLVSASANATDRIIAQQIMVTNPSLKFKDVTRFVSGLSDQQRAEVGKIIFSNRDRFYLPAIAASGGPVGLQMQIDLGIERDLGRHRAWERVSPIHETHVGFDEIYQSGFTQAAYLRQIDVFNEIQKNMEADMNKYYQQRTKFLDALTRLVGKETTDKVGIYLLPLAHQVDMFMNGDIRYLVHLQDIRIREGAHIDARLVVASANRQVSQSEPLYSSLIYPDDRVLVDDRRQFISRD